MKKIIRNFFKRLLKSTALQSIQNGFTMLFPIILIGSFSVLFNSFPISQYQFFLTNFGDGILRTILTYINNGTFGIFSIYITLAISSCYSQEKMGRDRNWMGSTLTSLACFMIMTSFSKNMITGDITAKGMFTAIVCALLVPNLYYFFQRILGHRIKLYADGTNLIFNNAFSVFFPSILVMLLFALTNFLINQYLYVTSLLDLFISCMNFIFDQLGRTIGSGLLYIFLSSVTWFFGIHGTNVLEDVAQKHFIPATILNKPMLLTQANSEILTRPFFSYFVMIGGCGATLCLIIAILLFSKRRGNRNLSKVSFLPTLFNINELTVFGLPIILNPILFVPFITTPLVLFCISYLAMWIGIVPLPTMAVEWTTPTIISGYLTTQSIRGSILQLINIIVGVFIYAPFIKVLDKTKDNSAKEHLHKLIKELNDAENSTREILLLDHPGGAGEVAKTLALDLQSALKKKQLTLYYQPQFDSNKQCIGAEALLRWNHPVFGMIYPPLVIKLAEEMNLLMDLEQEIFTIAATNLHDIQEKTNKTYKLSVNVSVTTLLQPQFKDFLKDLIQTYNIPNHSLCIEVTEQTALLINDEVQTYFNMIKDMGFLIALDDFSMGHTSLKYLLGGQFDIVKLDGSLVQGLSSNERCKSIIDSIIHLSASLKFSIIAEYVETDAQQKELEHIGCTNYQGYLYSPAIPSEEYIKLLLKDPCD